jgi:uncharacterized protein involved in response to NO
MSNRPVFDYALFHMGFRVFFALAGLSALALIAAWNHIAHGNLPLANYFPDSLWHGHEMLLGFASAVLAGFLLTALQNWTGIAPLSRSQLAALAWLWLYGRVVPFYAGMLPNALIALIDLSFLPLLSLCMLRNLRSYRQRIYLAFPGLLLIMTLGNVWLHWQVLHGICDSRGLMLIVGVLLFMILVTAGRLFPFFTERGIGGVVCIRNTLLDGLSIASAVLALGLWLGHIGGFLLALAALLAAAVNSLRIANWFDRRVLFVPLLWVLYFGYAWIILGFALMLPAAWDWVAPSLVLHAFTLGGIGVLSLGLMARIALSESGRALRASNVIALAFVLLNLAALFRVVFPALIPAGYDGWLWLSSYSWLAAFALFVFYYLPLLSANKS